MLPIAFREQMIKLIGNNEAELLFDTIAANTPCVSIRTNSRKESEPFKEIVTENVPWCTTGQYLSERPRFTFDPLLHGGAYYVQEPASMFIEQAYLKIVEDFEPHRVLDLCAAPGGKSTLWRSLLPDGCLLVANEPVAKRTQILAENLTKWGHPDVVCTRAFPKDFSKLENYFDVIATDVPCSGEGMFRKDPAAIDEWKDDAPLQCAERQMEIVRDVWPSLRPGGYLVYSTCTFNLLENESNVLQICNKLDAELITIPIEPEWRISGDNSDKGLPVYHFYPHKTKGEGLFLALLKKNGEYTPAKKKNNKKNKQLGIFQKAKDDEQLLSAYLKNANDFSAIRTNENYIVAVRTSLLEEIREVCTFAHPLTFGIPLAEIKGKKIVPCHALALSIECKADAFPRAELSKDDALRYLRRESIILPNDVPQGYTLATYQGLPLGFLNNLITRANNLYPAEWRIRTQE